jgi:hypothetical protein
MQTTPPENIDPIYILAITAEGGVRRKPMSPAAFREILWLNRSIAVRPDKKNTLPRTLRKQ